MLVTYTQHSILRKLAGLLLDHAGLRDAHGRRNLFQSGGGHKWTSKNYRKFLRFELATVTSQALKYDVISYTPYQGLIYTILDKFTPLWKRIG